MAKKIRIDELLIKRGMASDIAEARALVMAGVVYEGEVRCNTAGKKVSPDVPIEVRGKQIPYVSRGGLKLEKAIDTFEIDLDGAVAMDVGAATGGFTDCMLKRGAKKVYCVDVGYGQLAWKLRCDSRVVNLERTNIRYVTKEDIPEPLDFAAVDVSFISLRLVLPVVKKLLKPGGQAAALIKPQFEAPREDVPTGGVVRDIAVHRKVIRSAASFCEGAGFVILALTYSPVLGPDGNIEFLIHLKNGAGFLCEPVAFLSDSVIDDVTKGAHAALGVPR